MKLPSKIHTWKPFKLQITSQAIFIFHIGSNQVTFTTKQSKFVLQKQFNKLLKFYFKHLKVHSINPHPHIEYYNNLCPKVYYITIICYREKTPLPKINFQKLHCRRMIVNCIKINSCLGCMGRTNGYNTINCCIAFNSKRKQHRQNVNPLFWVFKITLPLIKPTITIIQYKSSFFTPFFKGTHHWTWTFL
jgi:hypothetical protein